MRTFVVTGGAGFIGSHITEALVRQGDRVRVVDNLSTGHLSNLEPVMSRIEFIQADVTDAGALAEAFRGVDCVIHQAALASVPLSVEEPLRVNDACVTGTLTVLDQARRAGVRRVVYAGSSSCYGDQPFCANRESDLPMTLSPYAVAKLAGEFYGQAFHHSYDLQTVCLRYFNVFGPRQDPNSHYSAVIPLFISRLLRGDRPIVYGDGQQSRDFTYVGDVVQGNLLAIDAEGVSGRSFNLASGRSATLLELLNILGRLLNVSVQIDFQPPRVGNIRDSMADITQAVRQLGYRPAIRLEEGLERSIEYYQSLVFQAQRD